MTFDERLAEPAHLGEAKSVVHSGSLECGSPAAQDGPYTAFFENAVEGMFRSTPEGSYIRVNRALAVLYGYASPRELMAEIRDIGSLVYADPAQRSEFKRLIEEQGSVENLQYQIRRRDGRKLWISENAWPVRDPQGNIIAYEGTIEDVTDRGRAELEHQVTTDIMQSLTITDNVDDLLRFIHLTLKRVIDAENCFVALFDPVAGMFSFPFFVDQFDQPPSPQKLGRGCCDLVFRTGQAMLISPQRVKELMAEGVIDLIGTPSRSWLGVPLRTPSMKIGVLAVQHYERENAYTERDLEFLSSIGGQIAMAIERKRAEEKLRESETRSRVLIEQIPAVLWTVDNNLRFTSMLGAGLARLGLKPNELVGTSLPAYFETDDKTFPPLAAHSRAIAGEPATFHVEWKEGSYACHVEPLRSMAGEVQGAVCMALDVTDRKQLEAQFRQAQKMEAIGRLAGGIAHDFNNLLMVIQGYADLLADRLAPGNPLRRNAEQIQAAAQRAAGLTQQLLAFSRKQMLAPKILSIHSVVSDMESILRRLIGEDIVLRVSSSPDTWVVRADRSQIEQVIMNLAVNARDAMPHGGRLTIETANVHLDGSLAHAPAVFEPGKYVMLAVTDNGSGMDQQTQSHIFEPFFTTKEKGKGTGLGLSTVYGVVKQSGGYIWVYSEPGIGTTFKIYLPCAEEEKASAERPRSDTDRAATQGSEVVLLVEDENGVRELAREFLQINGYTVIEAPDGATALDLVAHHPQKIHLLMTDVVMPGMSGRQLADRMLELRPDMKVLFMSGYTDQAVVHQGILDPDAVLLQKPFTMAALCSKLREILDLQPAG
jgi:PAS domain S-box-containing protein